MLDINFEKKSWNSEIEKQLPLLFGVKKRDVISGFRGKQSEL